MINYGILDSSIKFYEDFGFKRIESPWLVSEDISNITKPDPNIVDYKVEYNGKVLVASGEQSFLYMFVKGFLPKGRYQTITPCFRKESFTALNSKYFIKNELIDTINVSYESLDDTVNMCLSFFQKYIPEVTVVEQKDDRSEKAYDIVYGPYEIGSYGIRSYMQLEWTYATGVAEPRLSKLIDLRTREANGISQ